MTRPEKLRLLWSPRSPFVRKVMIWAHELGVVGQLELVRAVANPLGEPNPEIMTHNPLGQIPTLLTGSGQPVLGSAHICNWLSSYASGDELRRDEQEESWQVLADGMTSNLLQIRLLHMASSEANAALLVSLKSKVRACLEYFDRACANLDRASMGMGQVSLVCALGQLDFRFPHCGWRPAFPTLAHWHTAQATRPSVAANPIIDDQNTPFIQIHLPFEKE